MASNLDLNVIISASFEKLKKGMADAVNVVKGSTKKMEEAAAGSKKALEQALGGENLRVKRRELTQTINEQRSILTSFKQDLIALENKLAQTSKGDLMRQKALKDAIASLKVEIKDQESAVRNLSDARAETNFSLEEGSRKAEQNTQAMEAMSRAVNAASMATLLLSGNNEKVGKVMRGVQVVMALASAAVAVYNLAQRQNEIYTTAAAAAQKVYAVAVGTSTGAMKAFRVALLATGIGAAIFALGFLVEKFASLGDEAEKATDKVSDFTKAIEDDQLKALDLKHKRVMHQLKLEGATEGQLQTQYQKNVDEKLALVEKLIKQRKAEGKEVQELYDLSAQLAGEAADSEMSYKEQVYEETKKLRDKELKDYQKWLEDKRKLEVTMQENLTKFLQDEEAKRLANLSARRKPKELTEAMMAPAAPAAAPSGNGFLMALAEQNQEAAALDFEALAQWRANNADLFLAMEIRARKMQQFALKMEVAAEQASAALATMSASMVESFAVLLGDAITGKADAMQTFLQSFASSLAGFLGTFGKALIAQGIAIDAFKESLKSLDPAIAIIAGVGLLTASTLVKNAMAKGSQVQAFADGGIVSGPTLGLMGEYPGARSNPEVIAPLDKLQSMINTGGGSGELVASTRFDGRDLWLAVNRYEKDKARG
jgi:hypothetical protein